MADAEETSAARLVLDMDILGRIFEESITSTSRIRQVRKALPALDEFSSPQGWQTVARASFGTEGEATTGALR